jgi:hypothetical protein
MNITLALGTSTVFVLIALLIFLILFFLAWFPLERGRKLNLRPLKPLARLEEMIGRSAESGKSIHYSPGTGGFTSPTGATAPETLAGLTALSSVARASARTTANVTVTSNDALTYLVAGDVTAAEYAAVGRPEDYSPTNVRFITQDDRIAYAAGVTGLLGESKFDGNVMLGQFESEYLLAGDQANRRDVPQIVGSSRVEALPFMVASAGSENTLLGEEVYAAPAYLDRQPAHLASLVTQDRVRLIVIAAIILGVVAGSAGLLNNIGDYFLR